jgi:carbon-monoxide dehydrogenase medium subunit
MKPAQFEYHRAVSVADAIALLSEYGAEAKIIAGGQSLVPMMNFRLARPAHLIDVGRIPGLSYITLDGRTVTIGALTKHSEVEHNAEFVEHPGLALLPAVMKFIGHTPIRTRGTVGGSIAHADGVAEWPHLAVLLDATILVSGPDGPREVPAEECFLGLYTTTFDPEEVVTAIRFEAPTEYNAFDEFATRHGDFATAAVGAVLTVDGDRVRSARVVGSGIAPAPTRLSAVEEALEGMQLAEVASAPETPRALEAAAKADAERLESDDTYRVRLLSTLAGRVCARAASAGTVGRNGSGVRS